jgi:hypothetical protein
MQIKSIGIHLGKTTFQPVQQPTEQGFNSLLKSFSIIEFLSVQV